MATTDLVMPAAPIPTNGFVPRYILDGDTYFFSFTWNTRDGFWYLAIGDAARDTQIEGIKLTLGADKLRQFKYKTLPQGSLDVVDLDGTLLEMRRDDFGDRVILRYTDFEPVVVESRQIFPPDTPPS